MFLIADVLNQLLEVDTLPHLQLISRGLLSAQLLLMPFVPRANDGSVFRNSALPFWNFLFFRNVSRPLFVVLWGILVASIFSCTVGSVLLRRYATRNTHLVRRLWAVTKVTLVVVTEAGYPTCVSLLMAAVPCHSGKAAIPGPASVDCWETKQHLPLFILSLSALAVLVPLSVLAALTMFDGFPLSNDILARFHGRVDAMMRLWVAVAVAIAHFSFPPEDSRKPSPAFWAFVAACSLLNAVAHAWFHPFFSAATSKAHAAGFMAVFWFALTFAVEARQPLYGMRLAGMLFATVPVALFGWFGGGFRLRRQTVLQLSSDNTQWVAHFPSGLALARRRSSIPYSVGDFGNGGVESLSVALVAAAEQLQVGSDVSKQTRVSGPTVSRVISGSDVELATRFLLTGPAREAYRQGQQNLTPGRWQRTLASVADQYFQRGQRRFPQSPLLRLSYARFLTWWLNAYDLAHTLLTELVHDPSTPLDVHILAVRELVLLRGVADDAVTASLVAKARDEHGKALNALLSFLKEVASKRQHGGRAEVPALSHLAHQIGTRRQAALEHYREALTRRAKPDRNALVYWALFLEQLLLDDASASRTRELLERADSASLSQRSSASASSAATAADIPGLNEAGGVATSQDVGDGGSALGMARLLQANIKVAFTALCGLVVAVVVYNFMHASESSDALSRVITVARLRSEVYQVALLAADYLRTALRGSPDPSIQRQLLDLTSQIGTENAALVGMGDRALPEVKASHGLQLTPIRQSTNGQQSVRMTAVWEFGDLLASAAVSAVKQNKTDTTAFDVSTGFTYLQRNALAMGVAYNRSLWLYAELLPHHGRRALLGEAVLLLCGVFVISVTALLFLWSFTRIAQQRFVVLRFFTALPGDVITQLVQQTEAHLRLFKHPPLARCVVDQEDSADEAESDPSLPPVPMRPTTVLMQQAQQSTGRRGTTTPGGPTLVEDVFLSADSDKVFWQQATSRSRSDHRESGATFPRSPSPDHRESLVSVQSPPSSPQRRVPALALKHAQPSVPHQKVRIVVPGETTQRTDQPAISTAVPAYADPEPLQQPLRRIGSEAALGGEQRAGSANGRTPRRAAAGKQAPLRVFILLALLFALVAVAIVLVVRQLTDLGSMETEADRDMGTYVNSARLWLQHYVRNRQARKYAYFAQMRRYTQYWDQDLLSQGAALDLGRSLAPQSFLSSVYNTYYVGLNAVRNQELTTFVLAAWCYDLAIPTTMPEVMYWRWSADANATVSDPITSQPPSGHFDYAKDKNSSKPAQCQMARGVLFTDAFTPVVEAPGTTLQAAMETAFQSMNSNLDEAEQALKSQGSAVLGIYGAVVAVLCLLALELGLRHKLLWQSRTVRVLLLASVAACLAVVAATATASAELRKETTAIRHRFQVTRFTLLQERVVDQLGTFAFQFTAVPSLTWYNLYWQTYRGFYDTWKDLSFLSAQLQAAAAVVRQQHKDLMWIDNISLVLIGTLMGWLDRMPEVQNGQWDGSNIPNALFTNRTFDTTLPPEKMLELARKNLCDDVDGGRRTAVTNGLAAMQALSEADTSAIVTEASDSRRSTAWVVLIISACLGTVSLALGLVLAVKALDVSGSQALRRLNDLTLNRHVRRQRLGLALVAALFVLLLAVVAASALPAANRAPELAWELEHEASAALCALHASGAVTAQNNATFKQSQKKLTECMDRMLLARQSLYTARGEKLAANLGMAFGADTSSASNVTLPTDVKGLYFLYSAFVALGQRITTASNSLSTDLPDAFSQLRGNFNRMLPLLRASQDSLWDGLASLRRREEALLCALAAVFLLALVCEYVLLFRPMLQQLLEDQAVMRTLLSLIPDSALTADMEEFLETGAVGNSDRLLEEEDDLAACEERVESEADELLFMMPELETYKRTDNPTVVCGTEGTVLWANPSAIARFGADCVGSHVSIVIPAHVAVVLGAEIRSSGGRRVGLAGGAAAELKTSARTHPKTGAAYRICNLTVLKEESTVATCRARLENVGADLEEAGSELDTLAGGAFVCNAQGKIAHASPNAESALCRACSALKGEDIRQFVRLPPPEDASESDCLCPVAVDALVLPEGRPPQPFFVHVTPLTPDAFAVVLYPIAAATAAANRHSSTTAGALGSVGPGGAPVLGQVRRTKQPKHSEMQSKRCTVLHLELVGGTNANTNGGPVGQVAAAKSRQLLNAVFDTATKHNGHLHWTMGDQVILTFNHSSANGSHALAACSAATDLLASDLFRDRDPNSACRIGIASSTALCGYYGRLPVLQGDCLPQASLMLAVLRVVPARCAIDQTVWQAAQYSYYTRMVNVVTLANTGGSARIYELGALKQHEMDEWMYQLAQADTPFISYDAAVQQLLRSQQAAAHANLQKHLSSSPDDRVASWLCNLVERQQDQMQGTTDWSGNSLAWG